MTTVYIVRHGQSVANLEERFAGHSDFPLTDLGRKQAELAGNYLVEKKIRLDAAYASDLCRAFETGRIIAEKQGLVPVPAPGLREIYAGKWESMKFIEIYEQFPESFGVWRRNIGRARCDGGESIAELRVRVLAAVKEIVGGNRGKKILLAFHGAAIRALEAELRRLSPDEVKDLDWVGNASISVVEFDDDLNWNILQWDSREHLGDLVSDLPASV